MFIGHRFDAFLAVTLLSAVAYQPTTATLNYNNICLLTQNGEKISAADSCTNYYYCQNNVAVLQSCPNGLYFSKDAQACMPASSVNCGSSNNVNPCSGVSIGTFTGVQNSCSGYYYCGANGPERGDCPSGENFNPTTKACNYAANYPCGTIDDNNGPVDAGVNLCTFMPNGIFFGSASSCAAWNFCTNNALTTGTCPGSLVFNPLIGKCDYSSNVPCTQVTNDPNLVDSPLQGGVCSTVGATKPSSQCAEYYLCNGAYFQLVSCPKGLYFDTVSQSCVDRMNARNNCDRCEGTKESFVNMYSNQGCNGYIYCKNGVQKSTGLCPAGSYFNELAGACQIGVQPNFGCCNPKFYAPAVAPPPSPPTSPSDTPSNSSSDPAKTPSDPNTPSDSQANSPSTSTDSKANSPNTSSDSQANSPSTSTDSKANSPNTSSDSQANSPNTSSDSQANSPNTSTDSKANSPNTSSDSQANSPNTSSDSQANSPNTSTDSKANSPNTSSDSQANTPNTSSDSQANSPNTSSGSQANSPNTSSGSQADSSNTSSDNQAASKP